MRIGEYDFNPERYELTRGGRRVKLERLPMEFLILLLEHPGLMLTRDHIVERLWGKDKFLDVDNSINTAVRKLRAALRDSPARSAYIQTVTGKGYRFVAPVDAPEGERGRPVTKRRVMLAVLPFENLSADPEQEYFADGLTEETISHLGRMDPLEMGVIARTSSMVYKHTRKSVTEIGGELGVDYILENSVRRDRNHVRIASQLIRVKDQSHIWADTYDRDAVHFLGVQDELGKAIARQVQLKLLPGTHNPRLQAQDVDAYDLYLRGRHCWNQLTPGSILRAIGYFEQALESDPNYALAHVGLAEAYAMLPITSDSAVTDVLEKAQAAAAKAIELSDSLAETHAAIGAIKLWMEWDWTGAEAALRRAIELNPSYVHAHRWYAVLLCALGRHSESAEQMKCARQVDPLSALMHGLSGALLFLDRNYESAMKFLGEAIALNSNLWVLHLWIAKVYEQEGSLGKAVEEYQRAFDLSGGNSEALALKACARAQLGDRTEAYQTVQVLTEVAKSKYVPPSNLAIVYAGLGQEEQALDYLDQAYRTRDARLPLIAVDPKWDSLRKHGRFQALLVRLSLPTPVAVSA